MISPADRISIYAFAIRLDGGTQSRAALVEEEIGEYAERMRGGVVFPALTVAYDGTDYWLVDGFHRLEASRRADLEQVECDVIQGTKDDARWLSCSVNAAHGLPRTNADKRRAVVTALHHPKSKGLSDRAIAQHCGVSNHFVSDLRKTIPNCDPITVGTRTGLDGKKRRVASKPAPAEVSWPMVGADGYYADNVGILRNKECAGGVIFLRALQVGENDWRASYSLSLDGYEFKDRIGRRSSPYIDSSAAFESVAESAATRLRLRYTTADQSELCRVQIRALAAWLREKLLVPYELVSVVLEDGAGDDGGAIDEQYPEPNDKGVYPDEHPSVRTVTWQGPKGAQADIRVAPLRQDHRGVRWISAVRVNLGGAGMGAGLADRAWYCSEEEARVAAACGLAKWLHETERGGGITAVTKKQIVACRKWAVEHGADLAMIEEEIRSARQRDEDRVDELVANLLDGVGTILHAMGRLGCSAEDTVRRMIRLAGDPDGEDDYREALANLPRVVQYLGHLAQIHNSEEKHAA